MNVYEKPPQPDWKLGDWCSAAGKVSPADLIKIGQSLNAAERINEAIKRWRTGTIQTWLHGHIAEREHACAMIAVLRESAKRHGIPLFTNNTLRDHANTFMSSSACRPGGFTPLSSEELAIIARVPVPDIDPRYSDADLLRKVYPPPPVRPFGRDEEIHNLLGVIGESLITVIVSAPGNGKTTLAWHAGRRAVTDGLVTAMDWTTDKRVMITSSGEARTIGAGTPLRFESIIASAIRRFGWQEMLLAPDHRLPDLATKRFADRHYLLVVDNLETVPQASLVVTALRGLLEPRGQYAPLSSRAIITSRVAIEDVPGVRHVHIGGLALEPSGELVRSLEKNSGFEKRCSDSQIEQLWTLTKGNPLLLQIAITRSMQQNGRFEDILHDLSDGTGFMDVFDRLFGPLIETMSDENPQAGFLAGYAALLADQTMRELHGAWTREYGGGDSRFNAALMALVHYGVLKPLSGDDNEYAIHPMVRLYLRHLHGI